MLDQDLTTLLHTTAHRPYGLPNRPWRLRQRWNDLLFCHWPVPAAMLQALIPAGLEVETFDGSAWVGVIPFWMDRVRTRAVGEATFSVPGTTTFNELNLRIYVHSRASGLSGVYFFSLDCDSPLAVFGARTLFHLPYFPAAIERKVSGGTTAYRSRRQLSGVPATYDCSFGPIAGAEALPAAQPGSFEHFVAERYCLFTPWLGQLLVGHIHHRPWSLVPAEAEIRVNRIPAAHGITLPRTPPVLHFAREMDVILWSLRADAR